MQYHVQSLASHGFLVDFIGYSGSQLPEQISQNERVTIKYLSQVPGIYIVYFSVNALIPQPTSDQWQFCMSMWL